MILNYINTFHSYGNLYRISSFLYFVTNRDELRNLLMAYAYINIQNFFLLDWTIKAYNENPNGITIH